MSNSQSMGSSCLTAGSSKTLIINMPINYSSGSKPSASTPSPSCSPSTLVISLSLVSPPSIDKFSPANHTAYQWILATSPNGSSITIDIA